VLPSEKKGGPPAVSEQGTVDPWTMGSMSRDTFASKYEVERNYSKKRRQQKDSTEKRRGIGTHVVKFRGKKKRRNGVPPYPKGRKVKEWGKKRVIRGGERRGT